MSVKASNTSTVNLLLTFSAPSNTTMGHDDGQRTEASFPGHSQILSHNREKYWLFLNDCEIKCGSYLGTRHILLITMRPHPPERKGHQLINLVSPDEVHKGEPLEVEDEHTTKTPHWHLFSGLTVFLTLRAVPVCTKTEDCQKVSFGGQHFWRYFLHQDASELCGELPQDSLHIQSISHSIYNSFCRSSTLR